MRSKSLRQYARSDAKEYKSGELPDLNWASREGRRFMRMVSQFIEDAGGADRVSAMKLQLLRRASAVVVLVEQIEAQAMTGQQYDFLRYSVLLGALVKIARLTGIERLPKEVESLESNLERLQKRSNGHGAGAETEAGEADAASEEVDARYDGS
jgi:hypothetical protein